MATQMTTWRDEHNQIDLLIERADRIINVCKLKFSRGAYAITSQYADKIRNRTEVFRTSTHCTQSLLNTFIASFGILPGKNSSVADITLDMNALFN